MFNYWHNQYIDRGFVPGGMFVKDDLCYIPIPKNSSSYIGQLLLQNNWNTGNFLTADMQNKKIIVLLRDPIDRWISGMAQYLCSSLLNNGRTGADIIQNWTPVLHDLVLDRIIFDDHTEKQVYFINGVNIESCVFLNSDNNPDIAVKNFLLSNGLDLNIDSNIDKNKSIGNQHKEVLINFLRDLVNNDNDLSNRLKDAYKEDFQIMDILCNKEQA